MKGKKPLIGSMAVCAIAFGFLVITSPAYAASTEKVLYSFCAASNCGDGEQSWASLIFDSAGNLYGTTAVGGSSQYLAAVLAAERSLNCHQGSTVSGPRR